LLISGLISAVACAPFTWSIFQLLKVLRYLQLAMLVALMLSVRRQASNLTVILWDSASKNRVSIGVRWGDEDQAEEDHWSENIGLYRNIFQACSHPAPCGNDVANPADDVGPASIATFVPKDRSLSPTEIRIMLKMLKKVATLRRCRVKPSLRSAAPNSPVWQLPLQRPRNEVCSEDNESPSRWISRGMDAPTLIVGNFGYAKNAPSQLAIRPRDPSRRVDQSLAARIVAGPFDEHPDGRFGVGLSRFRHSTISGFVPAQSLASTNALRLPNNSGAGRCVFVNNFERLFV
jgi:hypothetical protein